VRLGASVPCCLLARSGESCTPLSCHPRCRELGRRHFVPPRELGIKGTPQKKDERLGYQQLITYAHRFYKYRMLALFKRLSGGIKNHSFLCCTVKKLKLNTAQTHAVCTGKKVGT
ncbi:unnamed protein product, partial [Ectocarpus sp. 12 AP-2014]